MLRIIFSLLIILPLFSCDSFDSFRDGASNDAAEAVVDETFLLAVNALDYIDPDLTAFTAEPQEGSSLTTLATFKIDRAGQCVEPTLSSISGDEFTVPTPTGGTGSCEGLAQNVDGVLRVELDCFSYRVAAGDVTIDGIIQYQMTQVSEDVQQFEIRSENPLGLDYDGDNCSGFLNYLGVVDQTQDKPYSVTGCITLQLCGPTWSVSGAEANL